MDKKVISVKTIYEGLFVCTDISPDYEGYYDTIIEPFGKCSLEVAVSHPHITVRFKPEITHRNFYGRLVYVVVNGYGCDENNEGYKVNIIPNGIYGDNREIKDEDFLNLLKSINIPHITSSISSTGSAIDTVHVDFVFLPMEERYLLVCKFGAFEEVEYEDGTRETRYSFDNFDWKYPSIKED